MSLLTPIATTTRRVSALTVVVCKSSSRTSSDSVPAGILGPTQSALPPGAGEASTLISELRTAILYAELLSNDNDERKLCSVNSPAALSNVTGIDGFAVQREVCAAASIQLTKPNLLKVIEIGNQKGVSILQKALFAVQIAGALQGGLDLKTLCDSIDEVTINNLFIGFVNGAGTSIKKFVCDAAQS